MSAGTSLQHLVPSWVEQGAEPAAPRQVPSARVGSRGWSRASPARRSQAARSPARQRKNRTKLDRYTGKSCPHYQIRHLSVRAVGALGPVRPAAVPGEGVATTIPQPAMFPEVVAGRRPSQRIKGRIAGGTPRRFARHAARLGHRLASVDFAPCVHTCEGRDATIRRVPISGPIGSGRRRTPQEEVWPVIAVFRSGVTPWGT